MDGISPERAVYLKNKRRTKSRITMLRLGILIGFIILWEISSCLNMVDSFIMSSPSRIVKTLISVSENNILIHIGITFFETLTGFLLGSAMGILIAIVLWWNETVYRVSEPYLVVLNSLPKIALGPVIIIWVGAGQKAIIVMALAISLIVTVLEVLNGYAATDKQKIRMALSFGATKRIVFQKIVFPSNVATIFNSLKISIGLSLVGVIAGEFLVSKGGLGYLIVYGGQVFKMDLVMASVFILALMALVMYKCVIWLEKIILGAISPGKH
ncbi:MAG: ABC transporter permease [Ruminococcaceae bacterium]|nr:ABC transporter permease [Oscillospiraceae bacterium]